MALRRLYRRKYRWLVLLLAVVLLGLLAVGLFGWAASFGRLEGSGEPPDWLMPASRRRVLALKEAPTPDWISREYIPTLVTARSGAELSDITGVVVHYVGNPGTSAAGNRNYFATPGTPVCSHFVVGLEGEVLQCLPLWEQSVASNSRNRDTISIEVCHPDDSGRFTDATYEAVVRLTAWLCQVCELAPEQVIRHYDVTGKECPRYFTDHPEAWEQFRQDVAVALTRETQ